MASPMVQVAANGTTLLSPLADIPRNRESDRRDSEQKPLCATTTERNAFNSCMPTRGRFIWLTVSKKIKWIRFRASNSFFELRAQYSS